MRDQLYNGSCTSDDATMRAVIYGKLEGAQFGLDYTMFTLFSALLERTRQGSPMKSEAKGRAHLKSVQESLEIVEPERTSNSNCLRRISSPK
jgi:hypothetical protein